MGKFQRAPLLLCLALSLCLATVRSASEECVNLVPTLVESCPAFEFAKVNDLSLKTGEPLVKAQDGQLGAPLIQAFDKIMAQSFDEQCCDLMQKLNASRCVQVLSFACIPHSFIYLCLHIYWLINKAMLLT